MGRDARLTAALRARETGQSARGSGLIVPGGAVAARGARDRFGSLIEEGDLVLYQPNVDLVFAVTAVRPLMSRDARLPPLVEVQLSVTFPLRLGAGQAVPQLVVVGTREKTNGEGASASAPGGGDGEAGDASGRVDGSGGEPAGRGAAVGGGTGADDAGGERGAGGDVPRA